jgi:hypothetical protein
VTNEKTRGDDEFSAIGKQTMARAYSAMDYYFDHLKKTVASAPSGGTEFGEKIKACAEQNICYIKAASSQTAKPPQSR